MRAEEHSGRATIMSRVSSDPEGGVDDGSGALLNADGSSFSGKERNQLFVNDRGSRFTAISGVSGLDSVFDARSFVDWDYDRDGWGDVALVNANAPMLEVFRSRLGERGLEGGLVAVRFVGANRSHAASPGASNRDGVGSVVTVTAGDLVVRREHAFGAGRGAQNSATLRVGFGAPRTADRVEVRFPSGALAVAEDVAEGSLLTVYEDPTESPTGEAIVVEGYRVAAREPLPWEPAAVQRLPLPPAGDAPARLRLVVTMATWCASCAEEVPELRLLREAFDESELEMLALPMDAADGRAELDAWMEDLGPPYELIDYDAGRASAAQSTLERELGRDGIPVSFVTNASGELLWTQFGPPTVSRLRALLAADQ